MVCGGLHSCAVNSLGQRFPNFLGCGPLLLLNIFRGPPGGLANTKDILAPYYAKKPTVKIRKHSLSNGVFPSK